MCPANENPGNGAAPAAAPEPTPSSITEPTAKQVMDFDPFGPSDSDETLPPQGGETGETGQSAEGEGQAQAGADGTQPQTPAQAQPVPATQQPQVTPQDQQLAAITQAIRQAIPPQQTQQQPAGEPAPHYNLGIPPQLLTAMRSEDPVEFGTAMHSVVNGLANKLWTDFQGAVQKELLPQIGQMVQGHLQSLQQQAQVANEFYGTHTALSAPVFRPLVQQAGLAVAQYRAARGLPLNWSPELANEIAEVVYSQIPQLRPAAQPQGTQPKTNSRPFTTGQGARPAAAGQKTPADEMRDLLL